MNRYQDHRHHELACHQMSEYLEGKALPHLLEKVQRPVQYTELNEALRHVPLLESLEDSQIDYLVKVGKRVAISGGELVFRKGDPGGCMYVILEGRIQIYMESSDGQAAMLRVLDSGQFFGEMAPLDGGERSANALTLTPCVFFTLERASFLNLIATYPELLTQLLSGLAERLRRTDERYLAQMAV